MDDVMYFLLGSVKELRGGFIRVLFPGGCSNVCGNNRQLPPPHPPIPNRGGVLWGGTDFMLHNLT